jgi:hypothetical protein
MLDSLFVVADFVRRPQADLCLRAEAVTAKQAMPFTPRQYRNVPTLQGVLLEQSYVIGFKERPSTSPTQVEFALHAALTKASPKYASPPPDERHCFRYALLLFLDVKRVTWSRRTFQAFFDAGGRVDYGHIDQFRFWMERETGACELAGEWGHVILWSAPPALIYCDAGASMVSGSIAPAGGGEGRGITDGRSSGRAGAMRRDQVEDAHAARKERPCP